MSRRRSTAALHTGRCSECAPERCDAGMTCANAEAEGLDRLWSRAAEGGHWLLMRFVMRWGAVPLALTCDTIGSSSRGSPFPCNCPRIRHQRHARPGGRLARLEEERGKEGRKEEARSACAQTTNDSHGALALSLNWCTRLTRLHSLSSRLLSVCPAALTRIWLDESGRHSDLVRGILRRRDGVFALEIAASFNV